MRIVIIGGLGMIGRAVADLAISRGQEGFLRSIKKTTPAPALIKATTLHWNGRDAKRLADIIDHKDAVINLAGESIGKARWTKERKNSILRSRLEPGSALVDAIRLCEQAPKTIVQARAVGIYGTGTEIMEESTTPGSDFLADLAIQWEDSTKSIESQGVRRIVIRTGLVLQRREGVLPQLMLPFKLLVGGPAGSGRQVYS